jgi:hypothetical protein
VIYPLNIRQIDLLNYKNINNISIFKYFLKFSQFKYLLYKFTYSFFFFIYLKKNLLELKNILSYFKFQTKKYQYTFFPSMCLTTFTLFANTNTANQVIALSNFISNHKEYFLSLVKLNKNFCSFNFILNIISINNNLSYKKLLFNFLVILVVLKSILINYKNLITLCLR